MQKETVLKYIRGFSAYQKTHWQWHALISYTFLVLEYIRSFLLNIKNCFTYTAIIQTKFNFCSYCWWLFVARCLVTSNMSWCLNSSIVVKNCFKRLHDFAPVTCLKELFNWLEDLFWKILDFLFFNFLTFFNLSIWD